LGRRGESCIASIMDALDDIDENVEVVPLDLPLDRETVHWLARLSRVTGDHPRRIVASMLHDIRIDDEAAHRRPH
jgi:hypothetical protein